MYYVKSTQIESNKSADYEKCETKNEEHRHNQNPVKNVHNIISREQKKAIEIIRWCFGVAGIPADSPRFAYYVSRWRVPEKIEVARANGTLEAALSKSPPIDPAWIRFVPDALNEYRLFTNPHASTKQQTKSSITTHRTRKQKRCSA